ncbi:alkene reductase [Pseudoalteromonas sp. SWXJ133]|uniref:alkene reductase n=1 Tax=Pseudoalteromonas sp. SWXJ133 TaxID=2792069 RepID=UPI0018CC8483|nr:alkene reductase [Pseudoalteromonas sp. SWXJ133]MBH0020154.1 alkene reductase [Pseudoalteromonas sp. SWXJ133]
MTLLFEPIELAGKTLKNRIVMPPMTRSRSTQPGDIANDLMATYYAQRASAGLIVSEGTQISELGKGYAWTPGIYSNEQVAGWSKVTSAVHSAGGVQPISASAIAAKDVKVFVDTNGAPGFVDTQLPREMSKQDITHVIGEFRQAAKNAVNAGFDGIELHAANGYLINQFLDSESNARTDEYGGSVQNRIRFLIEVVNAVSDEIGSSKVGVRLAPLTTLNGTVDENPEETYLAVSEALNKASVGYMHIAEADWDDAPLMSVEFKHAIRKAYSGVLIYAGKYTKERADKALSEGWADMIGFGRPFVSNPDLPARLKQGKPLNSHNPDTLFGGAEQGYTDYPTV